MVDSISVGTTGGTVQNAVRSGLQASAASSASASDSVPGKVDSRPLSPSTHTDPTTGVLITEYFSTEGVLRMQIPSEAAIAYMRSGMSASDAAAAQEKVAPTQTAVTASSESGVLA